MVEYDATRRHQTYEYHETVARAHHDSTRAPGHQLQVGRLRVGVDGHYQYRFYCASGCRSPWKNEPWAHTGNVAIAAVVEYLNIDPELLPVIGDRTRDARRTAPSCVRCGNPAAHEHHWAPRQLFDDADEWGVVNLCSPCHTRWHQVVRDNQTREYWRRHPTDLHTITERWAAHQ